MIEKQKQRLSNMELLRIVAMLMVLSLHYMGQGKVFLSVETGSVNYYLSRLIEALCIVAVNCYILISGYFLVDRRLSIKKIISLWLQVIVYSITIFVFAVSVGWIEPNFRNVLYTIFPLLSRRWSFVTDYIFMYIMSPFLNISIDKMTKKQHAGLCILVIFLLSGIPTFVFWEDTFRVMDGYSPIWFLSLYIIAAFIRKYEMRLTKKKAISGYLISVVITTCSYIIIFWFTHDNSYAFRLYAYNSLLTFFSSAFLFMIFSNIEIKGEQFCRSINGISKLTFGIFLSHSHFAVRDKLWILLGSENFVNSPYLVLHLISTVLIIFIICAIVEKLFQIILKTIKLEEKIVLVGNIFLKVINEKTGWK